VGQGRFVAIRIIESIRSQIENARAHFHDVGLVLRSNLCGSRSLLKPAQQADTGENLAELERLGDVIVGTHFETDYPVDGLASRRDHDDSHAVGSAKLARQGEPVLSGQIQIHQYDIDSPLLHDLSNAVAISCDINFESAVLQIFAEGLANIRLIIDNQNAALVVHSVLTQPPSSNLLSQPSLTLAAPSPRTEGAKHRSAEMAFPSKGHLTGLGMIEFRATAHRL
jgi:hypothetical protein